MNNSSYTWRKVVWSSVYSCFIILGNTSLSTVVAVSENGVSCNIYTISSIPIVFNDFQWLSTYQQYVSIGYNLNTPTQTYAYALISSSPRKWNIYQINGVTSSSAGWTSLCVNSSGTIFATSPSGTINLISKNISKILSVNNADTLVVNMGIATGLPMTGTYGGLGTKLILSAGTSVTTPYALGMSANALWYGVPSGASHVFYNGMTGVARITTNSIEPVTTGVYNLGSATNRWKTVYATIGTIDTSDSSLKLMSPLTYGMKEILEMETIKFKWKDLPDSDPTKDYEYYGFRADQLNPLFPELVYDEDPSAPLGMSYSEIIPILVNGMKELHRENQALKQRFELYLKEKGEEIEEEKKEEEKKEEEIDEQKKDE